MNKKSVWTSIKFLWIPFLSFDFGLIESDDANPILVGKHISEGKTPPLYNYG